MLVMFGYDIAGDFLWRACSSVLIRVCLLIVMRSIDWNVFVSVLNFGSGV